MADIDDDDLSFLDLKLYVLLIAVGSAAIVVTIYHCISVCWCKRRRPPPQQPLTVETTASAGRSTSSSSSTSISTSTAQLIIPSSHKYQKEKGLGLGLVGEEGSSTCAVCLCEFEEGEEIRTLPGCMHSFHMPCIDLWLYSHPNCPICRSDATTSPQILRGGAADSAVILQDIVVQQPRTV